MSVKTKYYNLLKANKKTIELRLFDEKRQNIKVGDKIIFSDSCDKTETFNAVVINLHRAKNFEELSNIIMPEQAGFSSAKELIQTLENFYSLAFQEKFGVVGIEIKKI
jgi:ASC-1-like (ASCH) protein